MIDALGTRLDESRNLLGVPVPRRRVVSEPCLPERLPSSGWSEFHSSNTCADEVSSLYTA